jgi:hypothetical protein
MKGADILIGGAVLFGVYWLLTRSSGGPVASLLSQASSNYKFVGPVLNNANCGAGFTADPVQGCVPYNYGGEYTP